MEDSEKQIKSKVWLVVLSEEQFGELSYKGEKLVQGGGVYMVPPPPKTKSPTLAVSLGEPQHGVVRQLTILVHPEADGTLPTALNGKFIVAHPIDLAAQWP